MKMKLFYFIVPCVLVFITLLFVMESNSYLNKPSRYELIYINGDSEMFFDKKLRLNSNG